MKAFFRTIIRCGLAATCMCVGALNTSGAAAQGAILEANDFETPRGISLGMGGRTSALGSSAVIYNPAALATARIYHLDTIVGYGGDNAAWSVGGAAVDSVSNRLAMGFAFRGLIGGDSDAMGGIDSRLALGMALSPTISIGVGGRYFKFVEPGQDEAADTEFRGFTLDASLLFRPVEGLTISALSYGLIPTESALVPMQVGGGVSYSVAGVFTLASDCLVDLSTFDHATVLAGIGAEYLAGDVAPLRIGYRYDSGRDVHYLGGGVGYVQQQYAADIGVRHALSGDGGLEIVFAVRYHHQ